MRRILINAGFALVNGGKVVQAYDMEAKEIMTDTLCAITTVPNDPNSEEDFGCTTTYEIAIRGRPSVRTSLPRLTRFSVWLS